MKIISLKGQFGTLVGPLRTQDARHDALGSTLNDIEVNFGVLDPDDLAEVRRILQKYCGGSSTVNGLGSARAGDAADVARVAAGKVRAQVEQIQGIAKNYKAFWDQNARENAAIRR